MTQTTLEAVLKSCQISPILDNILIICPNDKCFAALVRNNRSIPALLHKILKENFFPRHITIGCEGRRISFPIHHNDLCAPMNQQTSTLAPTLIASTQADLISECMEHPGACGIVRMSDHKGLFSNNLIVQSSNSHPNDWIGKKMSDWWIEDELNPYIERLVTDKELRNYSYVAKMMTGENARLTVDARVIIWNGEVCRLVKTLSREYLT